MIVVTVTARGAQPKVEQICRIVQRELKLQMGLDVALKADFHPNKKTDVIVEARF